ncbi:hypothetical protein [Sulfitobacter sp. HI0129]|uniref:hypothetical protein n=2 Tax=Sulfitobacter TaxID=60136 RepID=UPI0012374310|nr:hypothetical protein [Sulfitobacter sp. HI0129]
MDAHVRAVALADFQDRISTRWNPPTVKGKNMAVISDWIENIAGDETIEAVVIGPHYRDRFNSDKDENFNAAPLNKVISWEVAKPFLSYEYVNGYGGADCHPVFVWTATKIITITEYDGLTGPTWLPRNPIDIEPGFDGVEAAPWNA